MELTETHTLPVPQQQTWDALNDTQILRACIPGCESIDPDGENAYLVALSAAVGPVKARFKGRMQLTDIDAPNTYTIVFEGQGGAAGFAKGNARVNLEADDGAARKIAGEFFKRFGAQFSADSDAQAPAPGDVPAEADGTPAQAEPNQAEDGESGGEDKKGKKSWTAWISKF